MVKFLTMNNVSSALDDLIKTSQERLYLVSPHLQISKKLRGILKNTDSQSTVDIIFVCKKDAKWSPEDINFFQEQLHNVEIRSLEGLHAHIYLNEHSVLITSMNLFQHSQQKNREVGLLFTIESDKSLYDEIFHEVKKIIKYGEPFQYKVITENKIQFSSTMELPKKTQPISIKEKSRGTGHCIRCGAEMEVNTSQPLCSKCYPMWAEYSDRKYPENYCHICGKESNQSYAKPVCYLCSIKKYKK